MQEPYKKPKIPSYILGQKGEEMSQFRTDILPAYKLEDKDDKQGDAVLSKKEVKQTEVFQEKAKMYDEVSFGPTPEEEKIKPSKQEIILPKKEQIEIAATVATEVKQHIAHEKKELVLTTEEVIVSQELNVASVSKIEERTDVLHKEELSLMAEKEMVPQELHVEPVPKTDEVPPSIPPKKKELILISKEKMSPQELGVIHARIPEKMEDIPSTKKKFVLTSEKEMVHQELKAVPVPLIEEKEGIPHKKREFVLTPDEKSVPQELKMAPVSKIEERTSVKQFVPQELEVDPLSKIDKREVILLKKKEFILISEDKPPQELIETPLLKPDKMEDIPPTKKISALTSDEIASQVPKAVLAPGIGGKEGIPLKKKQLVWTAEEKSMSQGLAPMSKMDEKTGVLHGKKVILISEEMVPQESRVDHITKIEKGDKIQFKKKGFVLTSEEEIVPQEFKVAPVTKKEATESTQIKKIDFVLTSKETHVPKELKLDPMPEIEKKEGIRHKTKEISEEEMVHQDLQIESAPLTDKEESSSITKKEFVLTSGETTFPQEPKSAPVPKIDKGVLHKKELIIFSKEEETKPQKVKVSGMQKIEKKDGIPLMKKELVLTSEDILTTPNLKETPVPKVEGKKEIQFKKKEFAETVQEQKVAHKQLTLTQEPEMKENEQVVLKKKIDLTKEAELSLQKPEITSGFGKEMKCLITPTKEEAVSPKTDIIESVPEKPIYEKMEAVTAKKEPQVQNAVTLPGFKSEEEEDLQLKEKSLTSMKKKEFVLFKKVDTLIPAKDDGDVDQKSVTAAKGTMAMNALSFLSLHVFRKMSS